MWPYLGKVNEKLSVYLLFQLGGDAVTCVKLKESIDHVLAVGYSSGVVCIFQFSSAMPGKSQQVTSAFHHLQNYAFMTVLKIMIL